MIALFGFGNRVPRNVESKITQWVRFQHSEELNDDQVRQSHSSGNVKLQIVAVASLLSRHD